AGKQAQAVLSGANRHEKRSLDSLLSCACLNRSRSASRGISRIANPKNLKSSWSVAQAKLWIQTSHDRRSRSVRPISSLRPLLATTCGVDVKVPSSEAEKSRKVAFSPIALKTLPPSQCPPVASLSVRRVKTRTSPPSQ